MGTILSDDPDAARQRGQLNQAVRESLRDLSIHLFLLSQPPHRRASRPQGH
jgi:hypothetical protein